MAESWAEFWGKKNPFDDSMDMNFKFFLEKVEDYVSLTPSTVVLDIGSGPGRLEEAWQRRVKEIHAVDVSKRYNDMVRARHRDHSNIFVYDLSPDNYLDFSVLGEQKFHLVICIGVIQYYHSKEEVKTLLSEVKTRALPGARMVLADIVTENSSLSEALQFLKDAMKRGKFISMLKLMIKLQFSSYKQIRNAQGFLVLKEPELQAIIESLGLKGSFTRESITLHSKRKSFIIDF